MRLRSKSTEKFAGIGIRHSQKSMRQKAASGHTVGRHTADSSRFLLRALALMTILASCAGAVKHDEVRAAKRALEFGRLVLFEKNFDKGYELLADGGKRHVPRDKFKQSIAAMHARSYPTKLTAIEYEPMADEKAIYIYVTGQNSEEQFSYRLTMEGSAATDYRVLKIDQGTGFFTLASRKQPFKPPLSTE
jgi:hypothetical protein